MFFFFFSSLKFRSNHMSPLLVHIHLRMSLKTKLIIGEKVKNYIIQWFIPISDWLVVVSGPCQRGKYTVSAWFFVDRDDHGIWCGCYVTYTHNHTTSHSLLTIPWLYPANLNMHDTWRKSLGRDPGYEEEEEAPLLTTFLYSFKSCLWPEVTVWKQGKHDGHHQKAPRFLLLRCCSLFAQNPPRVTPASLTSQERCP